MFGAIILAAGGSKRMGKPKALLEFPDGRTLLTTQVDLMIPLILPLSHEGRGNFVTVVIGYEAERIRKAHPKLNVSWCVNSNWQLGQFSSLQVGISHVLHSDLAGIIILPIDVVGVSEGTIKNIITRVNKNPNQSAIIPQYKGKSGHPVFISKSFARSLLGIDLTSSDARLDVQISKSTKVLKLEVDDERILGNINSPKEWNNYLLDSATSKR